ncbi:MAG TPA: Mur ligase family protein [Candidatus Saccharimonadales bacterium]|nr:Mur ligase family protein [Candidatus Saccharimonadales bacterium]
MPTISTFAEANAALQAYWPTNISTRAVYSLDYMFDLMEYIGNPQDKLKVVHVAGTSGKTSTTYYIAALLHAAGKKVGHTVSPHVDEVNERVQINLVPLPEAEFCSELAAFLSLVKKSKIQTTYFEVLVAFMYWEFARQGVDYAVVEVGLGGLLDGTNVVKREDKVCVITDIGMDHMKYLGNTIGEIAAQKAGIIQLHNKVFCYRQGREVMAAFESRAAQKQADLQVLEPAPVDTSLRFLPLFQQRNFGLSLEVAQYVLDRDGVPPLSDEAVVQAAHTYIPGRMETIALPDGKTLVLDGAHNKQKLEALAHSMKARYGRTPIAALVSFVAGREDRVEPGVQVLAGLTDHIIITTYAASQDTPHASVDPQEIADACAQAGFTRYEIIPDLRAAYAALLQRPEEVLLITGSFYMLGHIRPLVKPALQQKEG